MRSVLVHTLAPWLPAEALVPHAATLWLSAVLVTLAVGLWLVAKAGLDPRPAFWAGLCGIAGGLVAGRLWLAYFAGEPAAGLGMVDLLQGQKGVMGVAVGASALAALALRLAGQPVLRYLDAGVPAAFVGYAVARVGCLLAGCCFGTPTTLPWGIHYPQGSPAYLAQVAAGLIEPTATQSLAVHPAAVYHALLGLVLCYLARKARGVPGRPLAVALAGYGVGRFLLEFLRGDTISTDLGLSVAQLWSIGFVLAGLALWRLGRRAAATPAPAYATGG
jgi:phosphatidylglycerol:prolipoprotein diacylglycerol transferase